MPNRKDKIHKRKDGRWEGRYFKERTPEGKIRYASVYGKSFQEVKTKLDEAMKRPPVKGPVVSKKYTIKEIGEKWLVDEKSGLKPSSRWRYRYLLDRHIYPMLGGVRIKDLTQDMIVTFAREKRESGSINGKKPLSDAYVNSMLVVLLDIHTFAVNENLCTPFPSPVSKPTPKKKRKRILSVLEMEKLARYLEHHSSPVTTGIAITLYAGLRVGEICGLQWKHIDLYEEVIYVQQTVQRVKKGDGFNGSYLRLDLPKSLSSLREIPIHPRLLCILKKRKQQDGNLFVLTGEDRFMNPATYEYQFHTVLKKAGLPQMNYHALRHSFTTACVEGGMDIKTLSEILGHARVATTLDIYAHPSITMKKKEIKKFPIFNMKNK